MPLAPKRRTTPWRVGFGVGFVGGAALCATALGLVMVACPDSSNTPPTPSVSSAPSVSSVPSSPSVPKDPWDPYARLTRPQTPEPQPEGAKASVGGRVLDAHANPIAGARVCEHSRIRLGRCTQSDSQGDYHLEGLRPGVHRLGVDALGFAPSHRRFELPPDGLTDPVDFELQRDGEGPSGVIQDIYGNPVVGAQITSGDTLSLSDERGHFPSRPDPDARLTWVVAAGQADITRWSASSTIPAEFTSIPESTISGRVIHDRTGAPVAGAKVSTFAEHGLNFASAQTDEAGEFLLRGLLPGDYDISVAGLGVQGESTELLHLGLTQHADELVIRAHSAAYVTGTVELGDTGRACPRGRVELREQGLEHASHANESVQIEDGGPVEFEALLPGTYEVTLSCLGYQAHENPPPLVVGEHNIGNIQWRVSAIPEPKRGGHVRRVDRMFGTEQEWGGMVHGRVLDEHGAPVSGVEVDLNHSHRRVYLPETHTDAEGFFQFAGLPSGRLELSVHTGEHLSPRTDLRALSGQELESIDGALVETELIVESRHGSLAGAFLDEQGQPVADALVIAFEESPPSTRTQMPPFLLWHDLGQPVITDARGRFTFEGLAERDYLVHAYRPGGGEAIARSIEPDSSLQLIVAPSGSLAGTVMGPEDEPPRSFYVRAEDKERRVLVVDDFWWTKGAWRLNNLPAGSYEVSVKLGEQVAVAEVELGQGEHREDIELRLGPSSE